LGQNHCKALADAGANVVVTDLNERKCKRFAEKLSTPSLGAFLDVTDYKSIYQILDKTLINFGRVDILINNAAINDMVEKPQNELEESKFENYSLNNWKKSLDVNLTGTFLCSQIIGGEMVRQRAGNIINIASTYGVVAPNQNLYKNKEGKQTFYKPPAYSVTKGGIISFTKYLAAYWAEKNIRVNSISPGGVKNKQDKHFISNYSSRTPLCRMAKPTDYMGTIIFLASDASSYMTGENILVDGGWTIW
jgi:NAD(P)-dependent dehydrogenase (short-subunit alcohol dehydrogenase family)